MVVLGVNNHLCIANQACINTVPSSPCKEIPSFLYDDYTLFGKISILYNYVDNSYSNPIVYTKANIDSFIADAKRKKTKYYGATDKYLYQALTKYAGHIKSKNIAILGSVKPWYESIVLAYDGIPTTIEYNKIDCQDSRLKTITVTEYDTAPQKFDALLSISSFEHDGLGRYGDPIDPYGDIKAMQKAKTMLKKGGLLFLAVPIGKDLLVWNLHRIYGKTRFPLLIAGWNVVESFGFMPEDFNRTGNVITGCYQPIFVLSPQ